MFCCRNCTEDKNKENLLLKALNSSNSLLLRHKNCTPLALLCPYKGALNNDDVHTGVCMYGVVLDRH